MQFRLTTPEVCEQLRISDSTLRRMRREGILKAGKHFRAIGAGTIKPALLWDGVATDQALAQRARRELSQ